MRLICRCRLIDFHVLIIFGFSRQSHAHHKMQSRRTKRYTLSSSFQKELAGFADVHVLDFSHRQLKDDDMRQFAWARNLRVLDLSGNGITDAGLLHLKDIESLMMLYLRDTGVTEEGVADLQKHLPCCGIIA